MIKSLFNILPNGNKYQSLRRAYLEQLKEAHTAEDDDLMIVEPIVEECPIYVDNKDLFYWIEAQEVDRDIKNIFLHCTATRQDVSVSGIINYWKNNLKWKNVGYHILLTKDGYSILTDLQNVTNGVRGYNHNSIHISYIGGIDANGRPNDNRTVYQKKMMHLIVDKLLEKFPNAEVGLHNEVSSKACPSFNRKEWDNEYSR